MHTPPTAAPAARVRRTPLAALVLACALAGCSSVSFERDTETSGTFESSAWAFTIVSIDLPSPALTTARGNASDARRPNMLVERERVVPYLGWFDWLLDVVGVRYAKVTGTWGYPPEEVRGVPATPRSSR